MASTLFLIELKREMHKVNMNLPVSKKYKTQISRMIQILVCTDDKRLKIWGLKLKGGGDVSANRHRRMRVVAPTLRQMDLTSTGRHDVKGSAALRVDSPR